jgi:hypothetical protein
MSLKAFMATLSSVFDARKSRKAGSPKMIVARMKRYKITITQNAR